MNQKKSLWGRCQTMAAVALALASWAASHEAHGRHLPEAWQQLDTSTFVEAARLDIAEDQLDEQTESAVRDNARDRLLADGFIASGSLYEVRQLFDLSHSVMDANEVAVVRQGLSLREDDPASMPFWEMQSRAELLEQLNEPPEQVRELVCEWCDNDGQLIDDSERASTTFNEEYEESLFHYRARWLLSRLRYETVNSKDFTATWTGTITAPRTGEYKFSTTPINPSFETPAEGQHYFQTLRASIDGNQVLNAKWDEWQSVGAPITLTADQPTPIQVQYVHSRVVGGPTDHHTSGNECPTSLLYWEGPGISRAIVPSDRLAPSEGSGQGLSATFQSNYGGEQVTKAIVDSEIDHVWISGICLVPQHLPQQRATMEKIWARYSNASFVDRCRQQQLQYPLLADEMLVECLNREQRLAVVNWATDYPELVNSRPWIVARQFFMNYRHDSPESTLDVLGAWMVAHRDITPELSTDFFAANRFQFRLLADALFVQYPPHAQQLQDGYLVSEDGQCVLPAAYTLAYGYLMQNKIDQWIELVDSHLADPSCVGDKRVNWLLARGQADEIRFIPAGRHHVGTERRDAGFEWIDEANVVAEAPGAKLRLAKERIARHAVLQQWDAAETELEAAQIYITDEVSRTSLSDWSNGLTALRGQIAEMQRQQAAFASSAYVAELTRRRDQATEKGDSDSASRYDEMIDAVGETSQ